MTIDSRSGFKQGVKTYSEPMRGPGGHETPPPPPKRTTSTPKKK